MKTVRCVSERTLCSLIFSICILTFYAFNGINLNLLIAVSYVAIFVPAAVIDHYEHEIPNIIIIIGYCLGIAYEVLYALSGIGFKISIPDRIIGAVALPGVLLLLSVIIDTLRKSEGSIGMGDIKAISVVGLAVGWQYQFELLVFMTALSWAAGLVYAARKKTLSFSQPLGPFILISLVIVFSIMGG